MHIGNKTKKNRFWKIVASKKISFQKSPTFPDEIPHNTFYDDDNMCKKIIGAMYNYTILRIQEGAMILTPDWTIVCIL